MGPGPDRAIVAFRGFNLDEAGPNDFGQPAFDGSRRGQEERRERGVALAAAFSAEAVDVGQQHLLTRPQASDIEDGIRDLQIALFRRLFCPQHN